MPSDPSAIAHDFGVLLRHAAENRIMLTPRQGLVPVRHIRDMMESFRTKEGHEITMGAKIYKKREEYEYPRFHFLDLLALDSRCLKVTRKNTLAKGLSWDRYQKTPPEARPFFVFLIFVFFFYYENWFRGMGGSFAAQFERSRDRIWCSLTGWRDGREVDWRVWAENLIRDTGIRWECQDQTSAERLTLWGLEYALIQPMQFFGILELTHLPGKYSEELSALQLNETGLAWFERLASSPPSPSLFPFSFN